MRVLSNYLLVFILIFFSIQTNGQERYKIACVGNSITYGASIENRAAHNYPRQLELLLGHNYEVMNFGNSGSTLLKLGDKPYWKQYTYKEALAYQPNLVIIKLGTNDSKPQNWDEWSAHFEQDYIHLIETFQNLQSKPKVLLVLPVPVYKTQWGIRDSVVREGVIPAIKQVAKKLNLEYIDLYTPLSNHPEYFPDFVHPNADGAKRMAEEIHKFLQKNNELLLK